MLLVRVHSHQPPIIVVVGRRYCPRAIGWTGLSFSDRMLAPALRIANASSPSPFGVGRFSRLVRSSCSRLVRSSCSRLVRSPFSSLVRSPFKNGQFPSLNPPLPSTSFSRQPLPSNRLVCSPFNSLVRSPSNSLVCSPAYGCVGFRQTNGFFSRQN
jgi:hypothetical protein